MNVEVVPEAMKWCEEAQQKEEEEQEEEVKDTIKTNTRTKGTLLQPSSSIAMLLLYSISSIISN
jgi:hypothetical protein